MRRDKDASDFGERDIAICPNCLHANEIDPSSCDYSDDPEISCKECDFSFDGFSTQQDFWYTQAEVSFATHYLRLRGYEGNPSRGVWYCIGCYMEKFIKGDTERCEIWNKPDWDEAFDIVTKYFGMKPVKKDAKVTAYNMPKFGTEMFG